MHALVEISDKQFFVKQGDKLYVPTQKADIGSTLSLSKVFLTSDGNGVATLGAATVSAKVLAHVKGEKVVVFKKKRRKRYRLTKGHRQGFTQIEVTAIA